MSRIRKPLPPDSVGGIVCPAWSGSRKPAEADMAQTPGLSPGGIGWEVLAVRRPSRTWLAGLMGLFAAGGLHAAVASLMSGGPGPEAAAAAAPLVVVDHEVDLTPPTPPDPEPPPEIDDTPRPAPRTARLAKATDSAPTPDPNAGPPPPARAGDVVASEAPADPLDFTGFEITTGSGPRYAGGVTASSGTNTEAVRTRTVDPNARPDQRQGEVNLARPVSLPARDWICPWPREAESLGIDEQVVVLRVVVTAEGRASFVGLLADPGHGFGQAALGCAHQARFEPATDRHGRAYTATSPPIRVRFTR